MSEHKPIGGKIFTGTFAVAFPVALVGGWVLIQRFMITSLFCQFNFVRMSILSARLAARRSWVLRGVAGGVA